MAELEEVFPLQVIESSENMVKVTFIAKEEGFYKIVFSNLHSWVRAKTLNYRYVVLKPVNTFYEKEQQNIGLVNKDRSRNLDVKIMDEKH